MFMICSSLSWTSLQAIVVPAYFSQPFPDAGTAERIHRLAGVLKRAQPHVTLLYDARSVDEHPIQPIFWTVTEFVLIRSMKGHDYLGRWPLRA